MKSINLIFPNICAVKYRLGMIAMLFAITLVPLKVVADSFWTILGSYEVRNTTKSGNTLSSFSMTPILSGIGVDRSDGTLWVSSEYTTSVYNVSPDGQILSSFDVNSFDPNAGQLEGVAVDNNNFSLWIVDDSTYSIYNVQRDGSLISSFSTIGLGSSGGQDIAIDIENNSVWVIDNDADSLFEFSKAGALLSVVPLSSLNPPIKKPQSLTFDEKNNTIWVVGYSPNYVYHIDRAGNQLHSYPISKGPHGIALDDFN